MTSTKKAYFSSAVSVLSTNDVVDIAARGPGDLVEVTIREVSYVNQTSFLRTTEAQHLMLHTGLMADVATLFAAKASFALDQNTFRDSFAHTSETRFSGAEMTVRVGGNARVRVTETSYLIAIYIQESNPPGNATDIIRVVPVHIVVTRRRVATPQ